MSDQINRRNNTRLFSYNNTSFKDILSDNTNINYIDYAKTKKAGDISLYD